MGGTFRVQGRVQGRVRDRVRGRLVGAIVVAGGLWLTQAALEPARAQDATKQIALSEKQVERFIAAQRKMASANAEDEFEAIAREHGFGGMEEHDDVEANVLLLMEGIDPKTGAFTEPPLQIKRRIEETEADTSLPENERSEALEELTEALETAEPIQFPTNIELVKRYYDKLKAVLE